jgi:hypothetical protein
MPYWMITADSTRKLEQYVGNGLSQPELNYFFGPSQEYQLERWPQNVASPFPGAISTKIFSDYNTLAAALSGGLAPSVKAVMYDPEAWQFTPVAQQQNPAHYEQLAAEAVHAHHLQFIAAPAADLLNVNGVGQKGTIYDKYVADGYAAAAAKYADVYEIQAQGLGANTLEYSQFLGEAIAQAKAVNPNVTIFAGLSTSPNGRPVTSAMLYQDVLATEHEVAGYWLNIPGPSPYSPNVTTSHPEVAVGLLNDLWLARS